MTRLTILPLSLLLVTLGCDLGQPDDDALRVDDAPDCGPDTIPCADDDGSVPSDEGGEDDGSAEDEGGSDGADECGDDDHGEDGDDDDDDDDNESDLPYNWELELGDTVLLEDAFLLEGPAPAEIVDVNMDEWGGDWRLDELASGTPFEVTEEDCEHEGNKDVGKDRIEITWVHPDGTEETDHMTLRYCGA